MFKKIINNRKMVNKCLIDYLVHCDDEKRAYQYCKTQADREYYSWYCKKNK